MRKLLLLSIFALPLLAQQDASQRKAVGLPAVVPRTFHGSGAPGSIAGNLSGDKFDDDTNDIEYTCFAAFGTSAPACTVVGAGGWQGGGGTGAQTLSNLTQIVTNGQRVDHCHQCVAGANPLVFDSSAAGATCSTGGPAFQLWSMAEDGSGKTNLSATVTALGSSLTNKNVGNVKFDPTGHWLIFMVQDSTSTQACNSSAANPGAGFDYNAYAIHYPDFTGLTKLTNYPINVGQGVLHPALINNWFYTMHITGVSAGAVGSFKGDLVYAPFSVVSGAPSVGTLQPWDNPLTAANWYETTGFNPNILDTIYFTSGTTYPTVQVYSFNLDTGNVNTQVSNTNGASYTEFWNCDDTGSFALSMSTEFITPSFVPTTSLGESDMILATCGSGYKRVPLTSYNNPASPMYISGTAVVSHPVWGIGQTHVFWTLQQPSMVSTIWMANFNSTSPYTAGAISQ